MVGASLLALAPLAGFPLMQGSGLLQHPGVSAPVTPVSPPWCDTRRAVTLLQQSNLLPDKHLRSTRRGHTS